MDEVDRSLISLPRQNVRMRVATLASRLGVSCGTVSNRLRKLEDARVIVGYTVRLRPDAQPATLRAWMGVRVEGNQTRAVTRHCSAIRRCKPCTTPAAAGTCWPNCAPAR